MASRAPSSQRRSIGCSWPGAPKPRRSPRLALLEQLDLAAEAGNLPTPLRVEAEAVKRLKRITEVKIQDWSKTGSLACHLVRLVHARSCLLASTQEISGIQTTGWMANYMNPFNKTSPVHRLGLAGTQDEVSNHLV